jgi:MFS transporter, ACS family, glucarate transporter
VGLKWGRRAVGMIGLGSAALFTVAAIFSSSQFLALAFLALSYAGICFNQPVLAVVCLDVAPRHAGAVTGSMNTIVQVGSFLSSVLFGYFVTASGSYDLPLIPMAVILLIGAALWLKVDPTKELVPEQRPALAAQAVP